MIGLQQAEHPMNENGQINEGNKQKKKKNCGAYSNGRFILNIAMRSKVKLEASTTKVREIGRRVNDNRDSATSNCRKLTSKS